MGLEAEFLGPFAIPSAAARKFAGDDVRVRDVDDRLKAEAQNEARRRQGDRHLHVGSSPRREPSATSIRTLSGSHFLAATFSGKERANEQ